MIVAYKWVIIIGVILALLIWLAIAVFGSIGEDGYDDED